MGVATKPPALGNIDIPAIFPCTDDLYTSPGYNTATHRIAMEVTSGIGNITIRYSE